MILISACLLGVNCRYDGCNNLWERAAELCATYRVLPLCPEQLGGLPTPRIPAEIQGGDGYAVLQGEARVLTQEGKDVSTAFLKGAKETLFLAKMQGVKTAILKEGSPSCGSKRIHDGTFSGTMCEGNGVTAALLKKNGIKVDSEKTFNCVEAATVTFCSSDFYFNKQ